jgi:molybdate transport system regulatory protein
MSTRARKGRPRSTAARPTCRSGLSAAPVGVRFRVDFNDRCSVGIGKISLLETIERSGSLSQAAREVGMSYRRAWLLVDSMNAEFDTAVISATVGGSGGGGARLTSFGRELIEAYRKVEGGLKALTAEHMSAIATHVAAGPAARRPAAPRCASGCRGR